MWQLEFSQSQIIQTSSYKFLPSQIGGDDNQQVTNNLCKVVVKICGVVGVTPSFKIKTECSSYVCPGIICHT
jgi:hypothetical protein